MENFDGFYDSRSHNNTKNQSLEKSTTKIRKSDTNNCRTICDISNVERCRSEKLRKPSVAQKYRSVYLRKYVWSKGVRHYRRYKKAFVIPVIHVSRRPDNPFNVKIVVENLRRKQMTCPLYKTTDNNVELPVGEESYSNLGRQIARTRNWEAIRYRYQLDYKERLKMERENYMKEYAEMKKMSRKQHNIEHVRPLHQNMDERIRRGGPYCAAVSSGELATGAVHSNRHINERRKNLVSSTETQAVPFNGVTSSVSDESKKYYSQLKYDNSSICKSADSTKDYKNGNPIPRTELDKLRYTRNERVNRNQSEMKQNEIVVDSDKVITPASMEHEMQRNSQSEDFDFSIPFNESNILVKVMTPDRNNPVTNHHRQSLSLLQETLLYDTKPTKPEAKSSNRIALDVGSNTNDIQPDSRQKNEWLQYIQNLLNKTPQLVGQPVKKAQIYAPSSENNRSYFDHGPITTTTTIQGPNAPHVTNTTNTNSHLRKYPDPHQSIGRVKVDRPVVSNPRLIRPKVVHPSPYYRSDFFRNNPLYNESMENPIVLNMPVRSHSPATIIPDQPNIPPHMEYAAYPNHPNYLHDFMVRSMRPYDSSHVNLMGQPVYSPYDQTYMQYPFEVEQMPHPYIDRFVQHNNVPPPNRSIGFLPPKPTPAGIYPYLNPHHDHPLWVYPHIMER